MDSTGREGWETPRHFIIPPPPWLQITVLHRQYNESVLGKMPQVRRGACRRCLLKLSCGIRELNGATCSSQFLAQAQYINFKCFPNWLKYKYNYTGVIYSTEWKTTETRLFRKPRNTQSTQLENCRILEAMQSRESSDNNNITSLQKSFAW